MKKPLVIGCTVVGVIALVIALVCGGFAFYGGSQFMGNNKAITEKMINGQIPKGFMPMFAMDLGKNSTSPKDQGGFAMLMGKDNHMVMLIEGPPIGSEEDKQKFIDQLEQGYKQNSSSYSKQSFNITPDGIMTIAGQEVEKYKMEMASNTDDMEGIAAFIEFPANTLLYTCFAKRGTFKEPIAIEFADAIKQR